ncbi:fatty acid desaturase [Actinomadura vinacea]|uniref:Fatty acid desaturase n=1 Tax=Actinomadura vinacea TaxID=115336 RepID=A0ABN3K4Y8_9ACTN
MTGEFSVQRAHALVSDLFTPRLGVYWGDLLASFTVCAAAFWAAGPAGYATPLGVLLSAVSTLAAYRCAAFIHELAHLRGKRALRRFRRAWNLLVGTPLLMPAFTFDAHVNHHNVRSYGTSRDPEYRPLDRLSRRQALAFLGSSFVLPLLAPIRFGLLTPLSLVNARLRRHLYTHFTTLKIDLDYAGAAPADRRQARAWLVQEAGCMLWVVLAAALLLSGTVPAERAVQAYAVHSALLLINAVRTLLSHRWSGDEEPMSLVDQMMDSINHPRRPLLTGLWAPLGLRLHALHHLFPGMPYHSLPEAHRRLSAALPPDSAYHRTASDGLTASVAALWKETGRVRRPARGRRTAPRPLIRS